MAKITKIEWATATWNPWIGCTKVSPACDNCYAERWAKRCGRDFSKVTRAAVATFGAPLKWKEPQRIFVCSLSDFFHKDVPSETRRDAMEIMDHSPQHTFMLLTKRPENIAAVLKGSRWDNGLPENVWLGCTVENQEQADKRIPELLKIPAAVHFVSVEPMLGPVDLAQFLTPLWHVDGTVTRNLPAKGVYPAARPRLDWVICGGESGGKARPMHPTWARSLRDQCAAASVPFMFKQWGEWHTRYEIAGVPHFAKFESHEHWVSKASTWVRGGTCLDSEGKICKCGADFQTAKFPITIMHRVGKARAGRLLDGVEHNGMPEVRP